MNQEAEGEWIRHSHSRMFVFVKFQKSPGRTHLDIPSYKHGSVTCFLDCFLRLKTF
jgi:hypothetical protein